MYIQHSFVKLRSDLVYIDFSKAFDKVDYAIFLNKLFSFGIHGNLVGNILPFQYKATCSSSNNRDSSSLASRNAVIMKK